MQLRNTRLCLDCEELHDAQQCPVCASESFAFLTRWVPAENRRQRRRTAAASDAQPGTTATKKLVTGGVVGVALFALSQWLMRNRPGQPDRPDKPD